MASLLVALVVPVFTYVAVESGRLHVKSNIPLSSIEISNGYIGYCPTSRAPMDITCDFYSSDLNPIITVKVE